MRKGLLVSEVSDLSETSGGSDWKFPAEGNPRRRRPFEPAVGYKATQVAP